ncbi:hypothetical protein NDU88_005199, partial [Pleurodeles waltl]
AGDTSLAQSMSCCFALGKPRSLTAGDSQECGNPINTAGFGAWLQTCLPPPGPGLLICNPRLALRMQKAPAAPSPHLKPRALAPPSCTQRMCGTVRSGPT